MMTGVRELLHSSSTSLLLLSSLLAARADTLVNNTASPRSPNVLFIVADDLGWNDVSWHNPMIHSPSLEQLAASGVLLDQYYVQPTCSPSRVAMMTGKYPYRVGRQHMYIKPLMPTGIPVNVPLMPQYFKDAGYTTHAIGKWHLGHCHQNYTPTYRGFDSFYGFYLGSQDYYLHTKHLTYGNLTETHTMGYDFRFNEQILRGPEVQGKYSADLFVKRAQSIFKVQQSGSDNKPWFTYLSFQSVHDPLQVPHTYKQNVCHYRDKARYYYSAMVSSLDHSVDQVVKSLKETGQYENTIIVVTTDNGGAVKVGGNNMPLKGTKGTLYEGGTRAIGFIHSPLLKKVGYTSPNLMHAVDWLPTLMAAIGRPGSALSATDGVDQWQALSTGSSDQPRTELVYNIKEKPFMAAIRVGHHKLIWGSRTDKNIWFPANEEVYSTLSCNNTMRTRSQASSLDIRQRRPVLVPVRGTDTMDMLNLGIDPDQDYWDEEEELERLQEIEGLREEFIEDDNKEQDEQQEEEVSQEEPEATLSRKRRGLRWKRWRNRRQLGWKARQQRRGRKKNKGSSGSKNGQANKNQPGNKNKNKNTKKNKKKGGGNKKGGGKKNKNIDIPNKHGVKVRSWGDALLFDLAADPNEKVDLAKDNPEIVELLKQRAIAHYLDLRPRHVPEDSPLGDPVRWGGYYGPGWCDYRTIDLD